MDSNFDCPSTEKLCNLLGKEVLEWHVSSCPQKMLTVWSSALREVGGLLFVSLITWCPKIHNPWSEANLKNYDCIGSLKFHSSGTLGSWLKSLTTAICHIFRSLYLLQVTWNASFDVLVAIMKGCTVINQDGSGTGKLLNLYVHFSKQGNVQFYLSEHLWDVRAG